MKNNFIRAVYIFCCGSSMYYFGYYVTLCSTDRVHGCSRVRAASALGFVGILTSAMSMVSTCKVDKLGLEIWWEEWVVKVVSRRVE